VVWQRWNDSKHRIFTRHTWTWWLLLIRVIWRNQGESFESDKVQAPSLLTRRYYLFLPYIPLLKLLNFRYTQLVPLFNQFSNSRCKTLASEWCLPFRGSQCLCYLELKVARHRSHFIFSLFSLLFDYENTFEAPEYLIPLEPNTGASISGDIFVRNQRKGYIKVGSGLRAGGFVRKASDTACSDYIILLYLDMCLII